MAMGWRHLARQHQLQPGIERGGNPRFPRHPRIFQDQDAAFGFLGGNQVAGVTSELRYLMLSQRTHEQAYDGMNWLYAGVDRSGAAVG